MTKEDDVPRQRRLEALKKLQVERKRLIISYVTSTRQGFEIQIADDMLRWMYEHLEAGKAAAEKGVDLFLHSNGGHGTVPWRLVNLIREYTKSLTVIVPEKAFSAATLIAMGADEILMHRMACLGPIDPSVANAFNPPSPQNPAIPMAISVEDVSAYFRMVKDEVGIGHEDELIQALIALTEKIHPLALGNVQRSHNQARMLARKLLRKHMMGESDHDIDKIIETLKSNLFYHGHPINRTEAQQDLGLKVAPSMSPDLERLIWDVFLAYEEDLVLSEPFNLFHEIDKAIPKPGPAPMPPTTQQLVQQLSQMAQAGLGMGTLPTQVLVDLAAAMLPHVSGQPAATSKIRLEKIRGAYVESVARCDVFLTDMNLEKTIMNVGGFPQDVVKPEVLWQRWEEEK